MPSYDFEIAKASLAESEKDILLCLLLNCDTRPLWAVIDWNKARAALGSPSVLGLKSTVRGILDKVANRGGLIDDDGTCSTPKASSVTPKKRQAVMQIDGDGGEEEGNTTPTPKRYGLKLDLAVGGPQKPVEDTLEDGK